MGAGISGGSSSSSSQSESGLGGMAKPRANEAGEMAQNWTKQVLESPNMFQGKTGEQLYGSGEYGLGFNVDPAIRQFGKQMYSLASAGGAARGRLTPEGAEAAAGDAITQSLPSLIPQLMQFGQWQFQLPMGLNTAASNIAQSNLANQAASIGGQSKGEGQGWNMGFSAGMSSANSSTPTK